MLDRTSRRRWLWVVGAVAFGLLCNSCNTPTLPLPPPGSPDVSMGTDGYALLVGAEGSAASYAEIVGYNIAKGNSAETKASASGAYSMKLKAGPGDVIEVWQKSGDLQSPSTSVVVP